MAPSGAASFGSAAGQPFRKFLSPANEQVGVDPKTSRKHYRAELDLGETKANAQVAGYLFNAAKGGNVTAQRFWLKTRAKWRETPVELRHSGSIGCKDLNELSDEELFGIICSVGIDLAVPKTIEAKPLPDQVAEQRKCHAVD